MVTASISTSLLISTAVDVIKEVHREIKESLKGAPESRYLRSVIELPGGRKKEALVMDLTAEMTCRRLFQQKFGDHLVVHGEELPGAKITQNNKIYALVDMIDGTDLLEMQIPLWCSAIVFFDTKTPKIIGAVIGLATGEIYYASSEKPNEVNVYRNPYDNHWANFSETITGPSDVNSVQDARICFYGQKAKNLLSLVGKSSTSFNKSSQTDSSSEYDCTDFQEKLETLLSVEKNEGRKLGFRLYNFAGNPIMVRLADRLRDDENNLVNRGFDAVFDIAGQSLHDVIPGVFIAKQANAYLCDLDGTEISDEDLAKRLLKPNDRMTYILASTKELANELREMLPKKHSDKSLTEVQNETSKKP